MAIIWFVGAWLMILSRSRKWWSAAWFWFVLAVINELANPVCPGFITRSIFYFLCSFGFLAVVTGYFRPKGNNNNENKGR